MTMYLQDLINNSRPLVPLMQESYLHRWVEFKQETTEDGKWDFSVKVQSGIGMFNKGILNPLVGGAYNAIGWYLLSSVFTNGPKVLRFKSDTMEALENYDLNFPVEDYHQPFETVIIDLPDNYSKNRLVMDAKSNFHPQTTGTPALAIVGKYNDMIFGVCYIHPIMSGITVMMPMEKGKTMEECWDKRHNHDVTDDESITSSRILRASFNACMLATHYGTTPGKVANPSHHARTQDRLHRAMKRKDTDAITNNRTELSCIPLVYEINQETSIYRKETIHNHNPESTGKYVSPHWRRGHWRMQRFGTGLSQTKRIPVPAVFVNSHHLLGEDRSHTTYTAKE